MAEIEPLPLAPSTMRDGAVGELEPLTRVVERLPRTDWSRPSAVEGWTVGDVIAHLDLFLGLYNRLLDTVLVGGGSGRVVKTIGRLTGAVIPSAVPIFDLVNSAIPKMMDRVLAPEVVKRRFAAGARQARERLAHVGLDDYTRPVYYGGGPYLLSFYLAALVNELAIHGWDIESELEEVAGLSDDTRCILPWFYWSGTKLMLRLPKRTKGTIQVLLSEPEAAMWWSVSDRSVEEGCEKAREPEATIRGPSGPYLLALAGRLDPAQSLQSSLIVDGDRILAERFLGSWHLV